MKSKRSRGILPSILIAGVWQDRQLTSLRLCGTYKCVGKLVSIGSGNGLSPARRQAITWTNDDLLSIGLLFMNNKLQWKPNRNKNIFVQGKIFKYVVCFCLGLSVLKVNFIMLYINGTWYAKKGCLVVLFYTKHGNVLPPPTNNIWDRKGLEIIKEEFYGDIHLSTIIST